MCCDMRNPKVAMKMVFTVSFGLSLLLVGIAHYMSLSDFMGMVSGGLGALTILGTIWAYVLPALMIVGGALYVVGMRPDIAAWTAGVALGSIPVGMLLKTVLGGVALGEMMPHAINAFIWLIIYAFVVKMTCCCKGSCKASGDMKK